MRKRLFYWELAGFLWTVAAGVLLHFTYDWSGQQALVAAFSAVNESTWEHMKLLFFPMFFFSLVQVCFLGRNYPNFPAVRCVSTLLGLMLIPTLYYTYTGILGYHLIWADMAIFFVAALGAFWLDFYLLETGRLSRMWQQVVGLLVLWGLAALFVWCTFHPPWLGLWLDAQTGRYGVSA